MSAEEPTGAATDAPTPVVSGNTKTNFSLGPRQRVNVLAAAAVVVLVGVIGGSYALIHHHQQQDKAAKAKQAQILQKLTKFNGYSGNSTAAKAAATAVINHPKDLSDKQLAQVYSARGDAENDAQQYAAAEADYKHAVSLDSGLQVDLNYRIFYVSYKAGERKTLIPLLQTLISQAKAAHTDFSGADIAMYQQYIDELQAGKALDI